MKKIYTNGGTYIASCTRNLQANNCSYGKCESCPNCLSNTLTIEGEYLPAEIEIAGMRYVGRKLR